MMGRLQRFAIIVAGGSGERMGTDIPKQFLFLDKIPILVRTVMAFDKISDLERIYLVLPEKYFETWKTIYVDYTFKTPIELTKGGATRTQSVRNALALIEGEGMVAIHDGVRPLIQPKTIEQSFQLAAKFGNAVAAVDVKESIRLLKGKSSIALDRRQYRVVQTPQTFRVSEIQEAYRQYQKSDMQDDAAVFEHAGGEVHLFEGSYTNIKVTTPEDLLVAGVLLKEKRQ